MFHFSYHFSLTLNRLHISLAGGSSHKSKTPFFLCAEQEAKHCEEAQQFSTAKKLPDRYPLTSLFLATTGAHGPRSLTGVDDSLLTMAPAAWHQHEHGVVLPSLLARYI